MKNRNPVPAFFSNIDLVMAAFCLSALILITVIAVFVRYVINNPFSWIEEIQVILFLYTATFGASVAFRYGGHIAIELIVEFFPPRIQKLIEFFTAVLTLFVLVMMTWLQFDRAASLFRTERTTNILAVPMFLIYGGAGFAFLLMTIRFILWYAGSLKNTKKTEERLS